MSTPHNPESAPLVLPVLYSFRRCPYAMRARLALDAAQVSCELRETILGNKSAALIAASPKGTVPVLVLDTGQVLDESLEIMRWALGRHDPEGWLDAGREAPTAAAQQQLLDQCDGRFKHHLDRYKYASRYARAASRPTASKALETASESASPCPAQMPEDEANPAWHEQAGLQWLLELEQRLVDSPWLLGPNISLVDIALVPFVRQFAMTDPARFAQHPLPRVQSWLQGIVASPRFERIMRKSPPWQPGTPGALFPFSALSSPDAA